MNYKITEKGIELKTDDGFDLKNTFECGQCFRWNEQPDGSYMGIVNGKRLCISKVGDSLLLEGCTEDDLNSIWFEYFDLGNDYNSIRRELTEVCPELACAVQSIDGIRILAQEPWEALCSFIISQNNNIPRIKGIVERLCQSFGQQHGDCWSFPTAETLAALEPDDLAPLRAGFRARYIIDAARKTASGVVDLASMKTAPIAQCRSELMKITGVGIKVAECTLLYGLHRLEAFPVDVWMKRALETSFSGVRAEQLGRYAGVAQQYIFHYTRENA